MRARREQQSGLFFVFISHLLRSGHCIFFPLCETIDVVQVPVIEEVHTAFGATDRVGAIMIDGFEQ